jgi:putative ABC transport system substrate-binding protein
VGTAAVIVALSTIAPAHAARVLVVQAAETMRLTKTLDALRARSSLPVDVVPLARIDAGTWNAALASGERPDVVVALGPRASNHLMKQATPVPVVHCLAGPDALRAGVPAMPSDVPADVQAAWLKRLVPNARTVGVAFNPGHNERRAEATAAGLRAAGYGTWMEPVESPAALPAALEKLASRADVVLAVPDAMLHATAAVRGLALNSFRTRIPLIGMVPDWVENGALYAIDWDYDEVGAACAQLVAREIAGGRARTPPPAPLRPRVWVNLRIAEVFGLRWDEALLRSVDHRHE